MTHRALCLALLAAAAPTARAQEPVLPGIDVLIAENGKPLAGRTCGLVTNHTGRARDGRRTIDALRALPDVKLVAIFSPEHGIAGQLDQSGIANGKDETS